MRILLKKRKYSLVWALLLACLVGTSQAMAKDRYEVFKDKVPAGARISVRRRARITSMCNLRRHLPVFPDCLFLSVKIPARAIPLYYICLDQMGRRGNRYAIGREKCEG